jgi:hypothetical protein
MTAAWIVAGWSPLASLVSLEVFPSRGNGFAASIVGALVALGILIVVMKFVSSKPKNRRRRNR